MIIVCRTNATSASITKGSTMDELPRALGGGQSRSPS